MLYLILLIVEIILLETSGLSLTCTNDYVSLVSCHIDARNCTGVELTLKKTGTALSDKCTFEPCVKGCCCGIKMKYLIVGDTYDAEVFADRQKVHSQTIGVYETIKPQTPTAISVEKFHDIYQIKWNTNVKWMFRDEFCAIVTYQKKGDKPVNSECLKLKDSEWNNFEIHGRSLEPSTTYVVSVKTYTAFNVSSDSSKEYEFTTDSSKNGVIIAVILSLCVVAIVISGVSFASFVKLKQKLWDIAVKGEKPKLLDIIPKKEVILTPESLSIFSLSVEPLAPKKDSLMLSKESLSDSCGRSGQTSGMISASSSLDYANTGPDAIEICLLAALKNDLPMFTLSMNTPESGEPIQNCETSASLAFENKSYIIQSPKNECDIETQLINDLGYHSSDKPPIQNIISSPASTIETDISHQPRPQAEDAFNAADSHNFLPMVYGCQDSNNLLSEHNSECQSLITGLTNILPTPEMGHFQLGNPQVSNKINVDYGYHSV